MDNTTKNVLIIAGLIFVFLVGVKLAGCIHTKHEKDKKPFVPQFWEKKLP